MNSFTMKTVDPKYWQWIVSHGWSKMNYKWLQNWERTISPHMTFYRRWRVEMRITYLQKTIYNAQNRVWIERYKRSGNCGFWAIVIFLCYSEKILTLDSVRFIQRSNNTPWRVRNDYDEYFNIMSHSLISLDRVLRHLNIGRLCLTHC